MNNDLILKRFFSKTMIQNLLLDKNMGLFDSVVEKYHMNDESKTYEQIISELYKYLGKSYRTEYLYKNTMLIKLLIKRHDCSKTIALTEFPIANSKADFLMINGKGVVYEIKTELDTLDRLESQIYDYYKAFKEVYVVTYKDNIDKLVNIVPDSVGIIELTKRNALNVIKTARECDEFLDYNSIFKILRKAEFEKILIDQGYELPNVNQFEYYKECFRLFKETDILKLQKKMLKILKERINLESVNLCLNAPMELKFLTYFDSSLIKKEKELFNVLNKSYGG